MFRRSSFEITLSGTRVKLKTEVLIIGGGATGAGISRDLALRGIPSILVEKGDLASGASGRNHGLLHSGARYALSDPEAAKECIAENKILRKIARIPNNKRIVVGVAMGYPEADFPLNTFERKRADVDEFVRWVE